MDWSILLLIFYDSLTQVPETLGDGPVNVKDLGHNKCENKKASFGAGWDRLITFIRGESERRLEAPDASDFGLGKGHVK